MSRVSFVKIIFMYEKEIMHIPPFLACQAIRFAQIVGPAVKKMMNYKNRKLESVAVTRLAAGFLKSAPAGNNAAGSRSLAYSVANGNAEIPRNDPVFDAAVNLKKQPNSNLASPPENNAASIESVQYGNVQEEYGDIDENIVPGYMTVKQYEKLELQSENAASPELGGPQDKPRPDEDGKELQCMELKEFRTMAGIKSPLDQSDGLTSSGETGLSVSEPLYATVIKRVKLKEPVTVQQPEQEVLESAPPVPLKKLPPVIAPSLEFLKLASSTTKKIVVNKAIRSMVLRSAGGTVLVQEFQTEAARCRAYCRAVNVQFFERALKASGYELSSKVSALEATYLKSYNDTLLFSYEKNAGNAPPATILRQAHDLANVVALEDVKALETEDGERYADVWSQFTMTFGANDMPINYSLKSKKFASRPLPPLPVSADNETEETRL